MRGSLSLSPSLSHVVQVDSVSPVCGFGMSPRDRQTDGVEPRYVETPADLPNRLQDGDSRGRQAEPVGQVSPSEGGGIRGPVRCRVPHSQTGK